MRVRRSSLSARSAEAVRRLGGVVLGAVSALAELAFLVLAGAAILSVTMWSGRPRVERRIMAVADRFVGVERARLRRWFGVETAWNERRNSATVTYLAQRSVVGVLGGGVVALVIWGVAAAVLLLRAWLLDIPAEGLADEPSDVTAAAVLALSVPALVLLYLAVQGLAGVVGLEVRLARRHLGPDPTEQLRRRISELAISRAGAVEAVDDERRRIERDLHDGVQQRVVALAMLLGRARRAGDPLRRAELLDAAHDESRRVIDDLRTVAWRVYPTSLDALGLEEALAGVAERSATPVTVTYDVEEPLPTPVSTAAYFVVSEAVTNATKHSGASAVSVEVRRVDTVVRVHVEDNGVGGADPAGGGLAGLARRVAALDGRFAVSSPVGGPTLLTADLPCD